MKKLIIYIFAGLLTIPFISSCSDFLDVMPVGKTTLPTYFSDMEGIRSALPGAYSLMYSYYNTYFYKYPEVAGNMISFRAGATEMIEQYNYISEPDQGAGAVGAIWGDILEALANVNNILEHVQTLANKFPENTAELQQIKAEALFLRALCHFDLCRVYAQPYNYTSDASHLGVPVLIKTPTANVYPSRGKVSEVYARIIKDLEESISLFGDTKMRDAYHVSKTSCEALLARVYLYMEDWDKVISYSSLVIDTIPLAKGDDYLAGFTSTNPGKEAILRFNGLDKNSSLTSFYSSASPTATPADTLISLFGGDDDLRLQLLTRIVMDKTENICLKYQVPEKSTKETNINNPIVLRCSEMYLNRAEAYLNKNNLTAAAADVKQIIARGLNKDISLVTVPDNNKAVLARIIEVERTKELCFEGHQFFDLVRRKQNLVREVNTNSTVKYKAYPNDWFVLPIPQRELDANTSMQPNPTVNK